MSRITCNVFEPYAQLLASCWLVLRLDSGLLLHTSPMQFSTLAQCILLSHHAKYDVNMAVLDKQVTT